MIFSLVTWYIAGEKTPGVVVFFWLSLFVLYYFFLKFPRFIPAAMIAIITQVLIIGYELQVRKIGVSIAETTGQPFYPWVFLVLQNRAAALITSQDISACPVPSRHSGRRLPCRILLDDVSQPSNRPDLAPS